jgi:hypothetical protein
LDCPCPNCLKLMHMTAPWRQLQMGWSAYLPLPTVCPHPHTILLLPITVLSPYWAQRGEWQDLTCGPVVKNSSFGFCNTSWSSWPSRNIFSCSLLPIKKKQELRNRSGSPLSQEFPLVTNSSAVLTSFPAPSHVWAVLVREKGISQKAGRQQSEDGAQEAFPGPMVRLWASGWKWGDSVMC